jgi:hypothetical protein
MKEVFFAIGLTFVGVVTAISAGQFIAGIQDSKYRNGYGTAVVSGPYCGSNWRRYEYLLPAYRLGCYLGEPVQ